MAHPPGAVPVVAPHRRQPVGGGRGGGLPEAAVPSPSVVEDGRHEARHDPLTVAALHAHRRGRLRGHRSHGRHRKDAAAPAAGIDLCSVGSVPLTHAPGN